MRTYVEYLRIKYKHKENDCYSLVRSFYRREFSIDLPSYEYEEDWYNKENLILTKYSSAGFCIVDSASYGDVLVFMEDSVPRHLGIYLGDGTFLHTTYNGTARHSCNNHKWEPIYILRHRGMSHAS